MAARWRSAALALGVAGTLVLGLVPGAQATNYFHRFTGRCASDGTANLQQTGSLSQGIYFDVPVRCTGTLEGVRVIGKTMRLALIAWPAVVNCGGTSVAHAGALLMEPLGGGTGRVYDQGVLTLNNKTRVITFLGDHIKQPLGVGLARASFTFSKPTTGACGTSRSISGAAPGSFTAT
jgi:hypothetical protein